MDPATILIPLESQKMQCCFVKATPRGGLEFAMVSIAIALKIDEPDNTCSQARIAIGAINTSPLRAFKAEQALVGHDLNEAVAAEVGRKAADEIKVLPHHGYSKGYLKQLVEVHTKRSLLAMIYPMEA